MNPNKQNLINKIIYRSQYRGTKEMDIFVSGFVKSIINSLSFDDLLDLDKLVNMNDEDIIKISKNEMIFKNNKILKLLIDFKGMAERLGFEPRKELPLCRFSRPMLSTAQPSLRVQGFIIINIYFNNKMT